jgi:hypothetical protein
MWVVFLSATSVRVAASDLPTNRPLEKLPYTRYRAERRDLLGRDAMLPAQAKR